MTTNNKYIRSTKRERLTVNTAIKEGAVISGRFAGSKTKGPGYNGFVPDTFAIYPKDKLIRLTQIKVELGAKTVTKEDHEALDGYTVIMSTHYYH